MMCAGEDGLWWNLASSPRVLSFSLLLGWLCTCKATSLRYGGVRASGKCLLPSLGDPGGGKGHPVSATWTTQGTWCQILWLYQSSLLHVLLVLRANQIWSIRSAGGDASSLFPECCRLISGHKKICLQLQRWWSPSSSGGSSLYNVLFLWHHLAHASTALSDLMKWCRFNTDVREERIRFNCLYVNTCVSDSCSAHNLLWARDFSRVRLGAQQLHIAHT